MVEKAEITIPINLYNELISAIRIISKLSSIEVELTEEEQILSYSAIKLAKECFNLPDNIKPKTTYYKFDTKFYVYQLKELMRCNELEIAINNKTSFSKDDILNIVGSMIAYPLGIDKIVFKDGYTIRNEVKFKKDKVYFNMEFNA